MLGSLKSKLLQQTEAAPLAVFRILFGLMMLISLIRFWSYGWIEKLYLEPKMRFSYYGFDWVKPLGNYTYLLFITCAASAIFVLLGYKYRYAIIAFFLSFTYIELLDKTTYLNHYYFISAVSFLLIFLPANAYFSIDAKRNESIRFQQIPRWTVDSVKLMLGIVYFYAGVAKLNSDWLFRAMPLKLWLPSKYNFPFFGDLFQQEWMAFAFSWSGMLYDLSIPFLLLYRKTRPLAFVAVVVFHLLTRALFPIGMFPYIMIISTLIFFDSKLHHGFLAWLSKLLSINKSLFDNTKAMPKTATFAKKIGAGILVVFMTFQILFPWRYLLYPGNLFWTEEGYRFSWRVMLMEKTGYAQFKVLDKITGKSFYVNNADYLTAFQEKQMSTQTDFMLQYAQFLAKQFNKNSEADLAIYIDSYVALNGRGSQVYIDPELDLLTLEETFAHKNWILSFEE